MPFTRSRSRRQNASVSTPGTDDTRFVKESCEMTYIADGTEYKDFCEKLAEDIAMNSGKELVMKDITLQPFCIGKAPPYTDGKVQLIRRDGGTKMENIGVSYDKRGARFMKTKKRKEQSELKIRWDGKDPNKRPRYIWM